MSLAKQMSLCRAGETRARCALRSWINTATAECVNVRVGLTLVTLAALAGCGGAAGEPSSLDMRLIDTNAGMWFMIALFGVGLVGGIVLTVAYRGRFEQHNLAQASSPAGFGSAAGWTLGVVVFLVIAFALYNWFGVTGEDGSSPYSPRPAVVEHRSVDRGHRGGIRGGLFRRKRGGTRLVQAHACEPHSRIGSAQAAARIV